MMEPGFLVFFLLLTVALLVAVARTVRVVPQATVMIVGRLGNIEGHERVFFGQDPAANYRGIIAIHDTTLGPALGGTRLWRYSSDEEALTDALRLSRRMTYKNALAGLPLGGGKLVILSPENEWHVLSY